jgi:ACS family hexuronate transporter-like MFS transporter
MSVVIPDLRRPDRRSLWKWSVCGLLLLATMVNYMDRLTLNQMAVPIMEDFGLDARQYGQLESAFGIAFALGAILFGWLADRCNVRWTYLAAVLVWSLAGFLTGLAQGLASLLLFRFLLGLAEAGNWPCALRTTRHILSPTERTLGNGILQSGAALGALLTPLIVLQLARASGSWRYGFLAIGAVGLLWAAAWLALVRGPDLARTSWTRPRAPVGLLSWLGMLYLTDLFIHLAAGPGWLPLAAKGLVTCLGVAAVVRWLAAATRGDAYLPRALFFRRFAALAVLVVAINLTWHFFRAWLPLFLQVQHGYGLKDFQWFSTAYYLCADLGSLAAGFASLALARGGLPVHASRMVVLLGCALLTTFSLAAAVLPAGPLLLAVLLIVGFAALGVFPAYYSFTQELTVEHQGQLTGALGCICWMAMALLHEVVGDVVERTGSFSSAVGIAGFIPLVGFGFLLVLWGRTPLPQDKAAGPGGQLPEASDAIRPAPGEVRLTPQGRRLP